MIGEKHVTCFYNVNYNYGSYDGQSKFAWGLDRFYLEEGSRPLSEQLTDLIGSDDTIYNLNLTSFQPFPDSVFEEETE